jgi:hypothetical protein
MWIYNEAESTIKHGVAGCLEATSDGKVYVGKCGKTIGQTWTWVHS